MKLFLMQQTRVMEVNQAFKNLINSMSADYNTIINLVGHAICTGIGTLLALRGVIFFYRIYKERNTGEDMTHTLILTAFFFAGTGIFSTFGKIFF